MLRSSFHALGGLLAVLLVGLAGCDSAVDSGGVATGDFTTPQIVGPTSVRPNSVCDWTVQGATIGVWHNTSGLPAQGSTTNQTVVAKATGGAGSTQIARATTSAGELFLYVTISSTAPLCP